MIIEREFKVSKEDRNNVLGLIATIERELRRGNKIESYFETSKGVDVIFIKDRNR